MHLPIFVQLEVINWLGESNLLLYAPVFVEQAVDSLQKVKALTDIQMEKMHL